MAFKNLVVEEMIAVSAAWVAEDNPAHKALLGHPRLAVLLSDLELVHQAIRAVAPHDDDPRRAEIVRLSAEADATYDLLARGIYGLLSELALLDANGAELIALRDALYPEGIAKVIRSSYRAQSGYAGLLRERLTPALRAQLAAIPLRQGNLLQSFEAWLVAGERLGALEEERSRLDAQGASTGQQIMDARNRWVRLVNALVNLAALAELDEPTERVVFGPLRDAEAKADQRAARRKPNADASKPTEDGPPKPSSSAE